VPTGALAERRGRQQHVDGAQQRVEGDGGIRRQAFLASI
jgi:hypothetical protein